MNVWAKLLFFGLGFFLLFIGPSLGYLIKKIEDGRNAHRIKVCLIAISLLLVSTFPSLGNYLIAKGNEYKRQFTIKSELDNQSLSFLRNLNGLMFVSTGFDINTLKFLIQKDILRTEVFHSPESEEIYYGYLLTPFGRSVLSNLDIKLFPETIAEMHRICHWEARVYGSEFIKQKEKFKKDFKRDFNSCLEKILCCNQDEYASEVSKINENKNLLPKDKEKQKLELFLNFLSDKKIDNEEKMDRFKKAGINK